MSYLGFEIDDTPGEQITHCAWSPRFTGRPLDLIWSSDTWRSSSTLLLSDTTWAYVTSPASGGLNSFGDRLHNAISTDDRWDDDGCLCDRTESDRQKRIAHWLGDHTWTWSTEKLSSLKNRSAVSSGRKQQQPTAQFIPRKLWSISVPNFLQPRSVAHRAQEVLFLHDIKMKSLKLSLRPVFISNTIIGHH